MNLYNQGQLFVYTKSHIQIVQSSTIQVTTYQLMSSLLTIVVGPRHTNLCNLLVRTCLYEFRHLMLTVQVAIPQWFSMI
jgi:hypothetical protein